MKSISNIISPKLQSRAHLLEKLTAITTACLPESCHGHVSVAGIRDNQLILISDSPVWASRIRLYSQSIMQMIEEHTDYKPTGIRVRQAQPRKIPEPPVRHHRHLDSRSSQLISQAAESISDPALKQALFRLSRKK